MPVFGRRRPLLRRREVMLGAMALPLAAPALAQSGGAAAFAETRARAAGLDQLHSLMVSVGGRTVLAERFRGPALARPANIKSVSKTLVATLLGISVDRGELALDSRLGEVAPGLLPPGAASGVAAITMEDLVTMRAGLERTSGANYGGWVASRNWVADALSRPMVDAPGGRMLYSTGSIHVLGAVLTEVTGQSLLALARARIGAPLGIEIPAWTRDPQGYYLGGNEMALAPAGMLAFGEAWLAPARGLVSRDWIDRALVARTQSEFSGLAYGLGWFLGRFDGVQVALARGYGGQVIAVAPERATVVAITSDPTRPARSQGYFGDLTALLDTAILPGARAA